MKTTRFRAQDVEQRWYLYDASKHVLGRMSADIAMRLMGKDRPTYTREELSGAHVVVINAAQARFTGKKAESKYYPKYSGYPGGRYEHTLDMLKAARPHDIVKQAADLLRDSGLNFAGNVEGDDIYKGSVDVVVCDGFVGNVALKASEGVAHMMASTLREEFGRNPLTKLAALLATPVLKAFKNRLDPRRYNGASLLGLRGIVIKSHGSADAYAFGQALERAVEEVRNDVPQRIAQRMAQLHPQPQAVQ